MHLIVKMFRYPKSMH